ncbi:MAG: hypothetical protein PHI18_02930, partial [bacterium]|nr:hypothetical protein [bacterium]
MRFLTLALAASLFPLLCFGYAYDWTTHTSTSDVMDVMLRDGTVWMATTGGLSSYDPATGAFEVYTNTRGLAMNACVAVGQDVHGFIWAGLSDARISRIHPESGQVRQIVDLQNEVFEITEILAQGEDVFVAANNGIYRFTYYSVVDNYRVLEPIKAVGSFPGETRVACLAIYDGYLYAGTSFGIARARLDQTNFSPTEAWEVISSGGGLPENDVRGFGADSLLWIITPSYVSAFDGTDFVCQSVLPGVTAVAACGANELAAATATTVYRLTGAPPDCQWTAMDTVNLGRIRDLVCDETTGEWFAGIGDNDLGSGGVSFQTGDAPTRHFATPRSAPGIGGNLITALAVDGRGRLWAGGSGYTSGVYQLDGDRWTNYTRSSGYSHPYFQTDVTAIAIDNGNQAWASTFGGGTGWFTEDTLIVFNTLDSLGFAGDTPRFTGIPGDPNYVVSRVARSAGGDIYITNRLARSHLPLVRVPAAWIARGNNDDPWEYYTPNPNPTGYYEVEEVVVDPLDRIWLGASRDGLYGYVLDRGNPSYSSDDSWFTYQPSDRQDAVTCYEDITAPV